jgi:ParB family chromosome partitioning protein
MSKPKEEAAAAVLDEPAKAEVKTLQTSAKSTPADLRVIKLAELSESSTNPRKHFNQDRLEELAESIRKSGVLVPLIVRKKNAKFEIIAGARRFRAAKLAGLAEVRCLIREYTDVEALIVQVVENEQREDVEPLDQAEGYAALMKTAKLDVEQIAAKVGKSPSFVYQRLKLAELIEPAKTLMAEGLLSPGHAILIARLQPKDQELALRRAFCPAGYFAQHERQKPIEEVVKAARGGKSFGMYDPPAAIESVRGLAQFIEEEIHCNLKESKFDKQDAALVPEAGSCAVCPKRTINNPNLFDAKEDRCTDPACFKLKCTAFVKQQQKKAGEDLEEGQKVLRVKSEWGGKTPSGALKSGEFETVKKSDKGAVPAVDVDSGKILYVKPKEPTGRRAEKKMTDEERQEHQRKLAEKIKVEDLRRKLIFKKIAAQVKGELNREMLEEWAEERIPHAPDDLKLLSEVIGKPVGRNSLSKLSDAELRRVINLGDLAQKASCHQEYELSRDNWEVKELYEAAKQLKIDLAEIDEAVKCEISGVAPDKKKATDKAPSPAEVAKVMKAEKAKLAKKNPALQKVISKVNKGKKK